MIITSNKGVIMIDGNKFPPPAGVTNPVPNPPSSSSFFDLKSKISNLTASISKIIFKNKEKLEIIPLGGRAIPFSEGKLSLSDDYWAETVPITTEKGEIYLYGLAAKPYIDAYRAIKKTNPSIGSFQEFMAEKLKQDESLLEKLEKKAVHYFNDKERKQTEVHVKDGTLQQIGLNSESDTHTPLKGGNYAFVIASIANHDQTTSQQLYMKPKVTTKSGKIQHSSFGAGAGFIAAGMIKIDDKGVILSISNTSGHYRPTAKELAHLINHLKEAGFDISSLHVTYPKNLFGQGITKLFPNITWGIVNQRGDRWFENIGRHLLAK